MIFVGLLNGGWVPQIGVGLHPIEMEYVEKLVGQLRKLSDELEHWVLLSRNPKENEKRQSRNEEWNNVPLFHWNMQNGESP